MDRTAITDSDLEQFGALKSLERLSLKGVRLSDRGVAALAQLQGLTHLDLSGPHTWMKGDEIHPRQLSTFGQAGLDSLLALPHLGHLNLSGIPVSTAIVAHFEETFTVRHRGRRIQITHPGSW